MEMLCKYVKYSHVHTNLPIQAHTQVALTTITHSIKAIKLLFTFNLCRELSMF